MTAIRNLFAAACLCAAGIAPATAQGTTFTNGSFDAGSLTGWQAHGDVLAVGGQVRMTNASTEFDDDDLGVGNEGRLNQSGTAAVDFFQSLSLAGIPVQNFDIGGLAYEGSAIRQDFTAFGGNSLTVTFDWAFSSNDTLPSDFGFLTINNTVHRVVDANTRYLSSNFLGSAVDDDDQNVRWSWYQSSYTYQASGNGTVSLALGVVDIGDTQYTSQMRFDNIAVSAVPEPETYALMLGGLGLMGVYIRRRRTGAHLQS